MSPSHKLFFHQSIAFICQLSMMKENTQPALVDILIYLVGILTSASSNCDGVLCIGNKIRYNDGGLVDVANLYPSTSHLDQVVL